MHNIVVAQKVGTGGRLIEIEGLEDSLEPGLELGCDLATEG
ncbi:unnamed protein product [uncultured virus]|nr:unnamed protein product [uncultured virus]